MAITRGNEAGQGGVSRRTRKQASHTDSGAGIYPILLLQPTHTSERWGRLNRVPYSPTEQGENWLSVASSDEGVARPATHTVVVPCTRR
jgi:hypothetical protein